MAQKPRARPSPCGLPLPTSCSAPVIVAALVLSVAVLGITALRPSFHVRCVDHLMAKAQPLQPHFPPGLGGSGQQHASALRDAGEAAAPPAGRAGPGSFTPPAGCRPVPSSAHLPVYLVHYAKLADRRGPLVDYFTREGFNIAWPQQQQQQSSLADAPAAAGAAGAPPVRWMTLDRGDLTADLAAAYATPLKRQFAQMPGLSIWGKLSKSDYEQQDRPALSPALLANGISHMQALEAIAAGDACEGLIFEDDVRLHTDFVRLLDAYRAQVPLSYGMLFLGDSFAGLPEFEVLQPVPWVNVYPKATTRTADAYLVSKAAAQVIVGRHRAMALAIDWHYNAVAEWEGMPLYWAYPPIASQDTVSGRIGRSY